MPTKIKKVLSPLIERKIFSKVTKWFYSHLLTIVCCTLIVALGTAFLVWSSPGTTTIGENISTGNITASGNLEVGGNATTSGNLNLGGDLDLNLNQLKEAVLERLSDFPSNATTGQMFWSTATSVPYWYDGLEWQKPSPREATIVVAASDSSTSSKRRADYVCDGVDDQIEIQAAINSLTGGRTWKETVLLLGGTFNISSTIIIPSYTKLEIHGKIFASNGLNDSLIQNSASVGVDAYTEPATRNTDIEICGGVIDGNKDNQSSPADDKCTIRMQGVDNVWIHHITMLNGWTENIRTAFANNVIISDCTIDNPADDGIAINKKTSYAVVMGNVISNAGQGVSYGTPNGIEIQDESTYVTVIGNVIYNPASRGIEVSLHDTTAEGSNHNIAIIGNIIKDCGTTGVAVLGLSDKFNYNIIIEGNSINSTNDYGMIVNYADGVLINGNMIDNVGKIGIYTYYPSRNLYIEGNYISNSGLSGIELGSEVSYSKVVNNLCIDNGQNQAGGQVGIGVIGDNNIIAGNVARDTGGGTQKYGIYVYSDAENNWVINNYLSGNTTSQMQATPPKTQAQPFSQLEAIQSLLTTV